VELSFDARTRQWTKPNPVIASNQNMLSKKRAVENVTGRPAVVQDMRTGNFEMLVIKDGEVCHYRKYNSRSEPQWLFTSAVYEQPVQKGGGAPFDRGDSNVFVRGVPNSVALYQCLKMKELHAVIGLRAAAGGNSADDHLISYHYSYSDNRWHGPANVTTREGMPKNVLPF
jgi:hypothetical protein